MKIKVGDSAKFFDEFGKELTGQIVSTKAFGNKGQYGIKAAGKAGVYIRTANEISIIKKS